MARTPTSAAKQMWKTYMSTRLRCSLGDRGRLHRHSSSRASSGSQEGITLCTTVPVASEKLEVDRECTLQSALGRAEQGTLGRAEQSRLQGRAEQSTLLRTLGRAEECALQWALSKAEQGMLQGVQGRAE